MLALVLADGETLHACIHVLGRSPCTYMYMYQVLADGETLVVQTMPQALLLQPLTRCPYNPLDPLTTPYTRLHLPQALLEPPTSP